MLVWWYFVDFDPWIRCVSSGSSFSTIFPNFHPQNLPNFDLGIIYFRPKSSFRAPNRDLEFVGPDIRHLERQNGQSFRPEDPEIRPTPRISGPYSISLPCFTVSAITNSSGVRFWCSLARFVAIDIPHLIKILPTPFDSIKFFKIWQVCLGPPL